MRDHERVAGTEREGRPVVELHRYVASHDVADLRTRRMAVPTGGDTLRNFGKGLDNLKPGGWRGGALQLRPLERGGRG
jgi:hypothetical protein